MEIHSTCKGRASAVLLLAVLPLVVSGCLSQERAQQGNGGAATERPAATARCDPHFGCDEDPVQVRTLYAFLNPLPFRAASGAIGIDLQPLWRSLAKGLSVAEIAEENGVDPQIVVASVDATHQARVAELVAEGGYSEEHEAGFVAAARRIAEDFVLEEFNLAFAIEHGLMSATDNGDSEEAGQCTLDAAGGPLLDIKYRLDILDDVRGGQHNFVPGPMSRHDVAAVLAFGRQNRKQLQRVADVAGSCGNNRYAAFLSSIADGRFGGSTRRE